MSSTFIEPNGPSRRHRKSLSGLLTIALWDAVRKGVIRDVPDKLVLASHFARADITALRDFNAIKGRLTAVRKTYTTTGRPLSVRIGRTRGEKPCNVTVVDTMLLCAAKTSLEQLGKDLGLQKVELPEGYSKDRMDLFLAERRDDFIAYALTDARIAALWAARIGEIMRNIGVTKPARDARCGRRHPRETGGRKARRRSQRISWKRSIAARQGPHETESREYMGVCSTVLPSA